MATKTNLDGAAAEAAQPRAASARRTEPQQTEPEPAHEARDVREGREVREVREPMVEGRDSIEMEPSKRRMPDKLRRFLLRMQGGKFYLPAAYRIVWFRDELGDDWGIRTKLIEGGHEAGFATVHAEVVNPEGRVIASGMKTESKSDFPAGWVEKAECVPIDTRILTLEGWKLPNELRTGEIVASYDLESDGLRWTPLETIHVYHNAPIQRLSNGKGFDVLCTPDHKWAVSRRGERVRRAYRKLKPTSAIHAGERIIVSAPMVDSLSTDAAPLNVTPEQAFVMGMLITDGCLRYSGKSIRGYICQSKPDSVECIRTQLAHVPHREIAIPGGARTFPTGRTCTTLPGYRWEIAASYLHDLHDAFGIEMDTDLPVAVGKLSAGARSAFMDAMMLAEGDAKNNFAQMPGRNDFVIDVWTALCALGGHMVCRSTIRRDAAGIWIARRKSTRHVYASNVAVEDAGRAEVWCPQTRYGTWVARFANDVVAITGNSGAVARALALLGFGTQFTPELDDDGFRPADSPQVRPAYAAPIPAATAAAAHREEREVRDARPAAANGAGRAASPSAAPVGEVWEGPGQCPRCHAPEGKRHAKPCVA